MARTFPAIEASTRPPGTLTMLPVGLAELVCPPLTSEPGRDERGDSPAGLPLSWR